LGKGDELRGMLTLQYQSLKGGHLGRKEKIHETVDNQERVKGVFSTKKRGVMKSFKAEKKNSVGEKGQAGQKQKRKLYKKNNLGRER